MKMKTLNFRLQAREDNPDEADLTIYDDIGEYNDFWSGKVFGYGPKKLTDQLSQCQAKTLNVHIASDGGDIFDGIAIHNILKGCGKTVNVIVDSIAASAASIIAMAGDTVNMYQTSQMMVHNCWTYACGNAVELRKIADDMDKVMASAKLAYTAKSDGKLTMDKLDKLLAEESYLSAAECLDLGLCDCILDKPESDDEPDPEPDPVPSPQDKAPAFQSERKKCWFF